MNIFLGIVWVFAVFCGLMVIRGMPSFNSLTKDQKQGLSICLLVWLICLGILIGNYVV